MEALQVENDHLSREIAILRETVKVTNTALSNPSTELSLISASGIRNEDRHPETDAQCQRREHQEAAGDAADQGRGQGGGGQGPSADADGGTKTGQGSLQDQNKCWLRLEESETSHFNYKLQKKLDQSLFCKLS